MTSVLRVLLAAGLFCVVAFAQRSSFRLQETGSPIMVSLTNPAPNDWGYQSIAIKHGPHSFMLTTKSPVRCIPKDRDEQLATGMLIDHVNGLMLDPSRCFFRGTYSSAAGSHTLLFFVGEPGASDAGPSLIIRLQPDGRPSKVLEMKQFDLVAFESGEVNKVRVIGRPTVPQAMSCSPENRNQPYAETYDPFAVYVMADEPHFAYSLSESKAYNIQHYVWAGQHSREDYGVVYNVDGRHRPIGATARRINTLLKKVPCRL